MGFDGQFFTRIDNNDKDIRLKNSDLEIIVSSPLKHDLWTYIMYSHYNPPSEMMFDKKNSEAPLSDENIRYKSLSLVNEMRRISKIYNQSIIFQSFGEDFHF